jgi:hypothetical protein
LPDSYFNLELAKLQINARIVVGQVELTRFVLASFVYSAYYRRCP